MALGSLTKETPKGKLADAWNKYVAGQSNTVVVNATRGFETLLSAKDSDGVVRLAQSLGLPNLSLAAHLPHQTCHSLPTCHTNPTLSSVVHLPVTHARVSQLNVKYASVLSVRLYRKFLLKDVTGAVNKTEHPKHVDIATRVRARPAASCSPPAV